MGSDLVAILEVAARMAGANMLAYIRTDAVYAMGRLVKVVPAVCPAARAVLMRCGGGSGSGGDVLIIGVLSELLAEGVRRKEMDDIVAHSALLLEEIALGERDESPYIIAALGYAELVGRRCVAFGHGAERVLNALMGVVKRVKAGVFVKGMETWMDVLEVLEGSDGTEELVEKVVSALSMICIERCMWSTNSSLAELEGGEDSTEIDWDWEIMAGTVAEVSKDPLVFEGMLFVEESTEVDEWETCTRRVYVAKCVETLVSCCVLSPVKVGGVVTEFAMTLLRERGEVVASGAGGSVRREDIEDLTTASQIALGLSSVDSEDSPRIQALFESLWKLTRAGIWKMEDNLGVLLLRAMVSSARVLKASSEDILRNVSSSLLPAMQQVLVANNVSAKLASAAALLVLSLHHVCAGVLAASGPPIQTEIMIATPHPAVTALGVAAMTQWAIVPPRDEKKLPKRWSKEEWAARQEGYRQLCHAVFAQFFRACEAEDVEAGPALGAITWGAGLLRTAAGCVSAAHGNASDAFWGGLGGEACAHCLEALHRLSAKLGTASLDASGRQEVCDVMGNVVSGIEHVLRVCRRQTREGKLASETVSIVVEVARVQECVQLARAGLRLIREEFANGGVELLAGGVELATRCIGGEVDIAVAAVGTLVEALKTHWVVFWPGDVVGSGSPASIAMRGTNGGVAEEMYMRAIGGIVEAVCSMELSVCRSGLLGLQRLGAARRLFEREEGFRKCVGGRVVLECLRVAGLVGGRESLMEEAVDVLWGIAKVDLKGFGGVVREAAGGELEVGGVEELKERVEFGKWVEEFVNDYLYAERRKAGAQL